MHKMVSYAEELRDELWRWSFDSLGGILHESWLLTRSLTAGITYEQVNIWFDNAIAAGALGGKLHGPGAVFFYSTHHLKIMKQSFHSRRSLHRILKKLNNSLIC